MISNNFQGLKGQVVPYMSEEYVSTVSNRYIELYENITAKKFIRVDNANLENRIEKNINNYLGANFGN